MGHEPTPLFRNLILIIGGGILIMGIIFAGILDNGEIIRADARMGPIIAATRILVPLFFTIGVMYYLASIKKCKACGKIFFWRRRKKTPISTST
ncbi:MAG: hypothetical protein H7832_09230 [Magnetococcus sp. DMHC-6]